MDIYQRLASIKQELDLEEIKVHSVAEGLIEYGRINTKFINSEDVCEVYFGLNGKITKVTESVRAVIDEDVEYDELIFSSHDKMKYFVCESDGLFYALAFTPSLGSFTVNLEIIYCAPTLDALKEGIQSYTWI